MIICAFDRSIEHHVAKRLLAHTRVAATGKHRFSLLLASRSAEPVFYSKTARAEGYINQCYPFFAPCQLVNPSRLHFWSMFSLIAPPAFAGTLLGLVPVVIMTWGTYVLLYGPPYVNTTDWILDSYKLHYMDTAVDPDNYDKAR